MKTIYGRNSFLYMISLYPGARLSSEMRQVNRRKLLRVELALLCTLVNTVYTLVIYRFTMVHDVYFRKRSLGGSAP